jgi:quinolinate synthase
VARALLGRFSADVVDELRVKDPELKVIVHPECTHEVVTKADLVGSTEFIIKTVQNAPAGSRWAIGTELNLVQRLAREHSEQHIVFLDRNVCYCATMNRISHRD